MVDVLFDDHVFCVYCHIHSFDPGIPHLIHLLVPIYGRQGSCYVGVYSLDLVDNQLPGPQLSTKHVCYRLTIDKADIGYVSTVKQHSEVNKCRLMHYYQY